MAKIKLTTSNIEKTINKLKLYRSGWANGIREGWEHHTKGSAEILFSLYEISGCIILSLEDVLAGHFQDTLPLRLVQQKLENLVISENFHNYDILGQEGISNIVSNGTKHHIRVMMETLETLTA